MKTIDFVIFGGTGNLAVRKLMPALFYLHKNGHFPAGNRILAIARNPISQNEFIQQLEFRLQTLVPNKDFDRVHWQSFVSMIHVVPLDINDFNDRDLLHYTLSDPERCDTIFYLAIPQALIEPICYLISQNRINTPNSRIVIEKPFGENLISAKHLNTIVSRVFSEDQIFRIDHYLGKETVQNLLALRFGNPFMEKIWDREHVEYIEITVAETDGVEGRAEYLDRTGTLRDMVQNHLLQLLSLIAMEAPLSLNAKDICKEKIKLIQCLRPIPAATVHEHAVIAQYCAGELNGCTVPGYLDEIGTLPGTGETFAALRVFIDNRRWQNTPLYLRTGKRMHQHYSEITVKFRRSATHMFNDDNGGRLQIRLQPEMQINMEIFMKKLVDDALRLVPHSKALRLDDGITRVTDAYEKLLLDVLKNRQTYFVSHAEIETAWQWIDHLRSAFNQGKLLMDCYPAGSEGPLSSLKLPELDGFSWQHAHISSYA